jgi:multidrug efflux pump subunit AcrA (membrane-fusion protein)
MAPDQPQPSAVRAIGAGEDSALSDLLAQGPARATRRVLYGLLLLTIACVLVAAFWRIDVTVTAPAVIIPEGHTYLIQAETSVIVRSLKVKEGDVVQEGDELGELESDEVGQQLAAVALALVERDDARKEQQNVRTLEVPRFVAEEERLLTQQHYHEAAVALVADKRKAEDRDYEATKNKLRELKLRLEADVVTAEETLHYRTADLDSLELLRRDRVASEFEVLAARRALTEATSGLVRARSQRADNVHDVALLEEKHSRAILDLEAERRNHAFEAADAASRVLNQKSTRIIREEDVAKKVKLAEDKLRLAAARAELMLRGLNRDAVGKVVRGEEPPSNRLKLLAPGRGRIGFVAVKGRGETVARGQTVLSIVPDGAPLLVEIKVPNREAGRVRVGQRVRLKVDAFPFGDYGMLFGEVQSLATEAESGGEASFRAVAVLERPYFVRDNETFDLKPGMAATAEIVTERKTMLQILLRPLYELEP